ncbi:MAG: archaeosortase/exosortase family protein, partial [Pseudomonadota bacterium]
MSISLEGGVGGRLSGGAAQLAGPGLFAIAVLAAIAVFWNGFASLVQAWQTPEYSHGPIIPLLSAYMFLREMRDVEPRAPETVRDRGWGVADHAEGGGGRGGARAEPSRACLG